MLTEEQKKELLDVGNDGTYTMDTIYNLIDKFISEAVKEERKRICNKLLQDPSNMNCVGCNNLLKKIYELKTNKE